MNWDKIILYILLLLGGFLLAWFLKPQPDPIVKTEVVYRDREITKKDTVTREVPVTRVIYQPVTLLDTVYVNVPDNVHDFDIVMDRPLRFLGSDVLLTYYDPKTNRWQQDLYEMPERPWRYGLDLYAAYGGNQDQVGVFFSGVELYGGYKRFDVFGRLEISATRTEYSRYMAGIKLKIK